MVRGTGRSSITIAVDWDGKQQTNKHRSINAFVLLKK